MVDLAEGFYHVFRNGNQIVIDLSRNNKYEYYYITPDDYTLRSYEGERPMTGGSIEMCIRDSLHAGRPAPLCIQQGTGMGPLR